MKKRNPPRVREYKKTINIYPFNYQVVAVLSSDIHGSRTRRITRLGTPTDDLETACALHCSVLNEPVSYIFLPLDPDVGYVAHECFHCVWQ